MTKEDILSEFRLFSYDDITHYQKIVVALTKTMEIMKEIDKRTGKWPIN